MCPHLSGRIVSIFSLSIFVREINILPIMEINDDTFERSIRPVMELLEEIRSLLKAGNRLNGESLLDNQDVCILFKITPRSLQRYRNTGKLPFIRIGGKPFYLESEVREFIRSARENRPPPAETRNKG